MTQGPGLYILFKRTLSVCFVSLICSFLLIEGVWAAEPPPPPPPPPAVPAGGLWGYLSLIAAIGGYTRWSKRKSKRRSKNHPPEDES